MVKQTIWFLIVIFLLTSINSIPIQAQEEVEVPFQVLLINSYHSGFEWTDEQVKAIISSFQESQLNIVLSIEYLDWKTYPTKENLQIQYELIKYKYQNQSVDLILTTDDMAMQFAIDYRKELFNEVPIVFGSVNKASALERMKNIKNITGVYEEIDPEGTVEEILSIHKDTEVVYLVTEFTESGLSTQNRINEAFEMLVSPIQRIDLRDRTFDEIKKILENPQPHSVAIMASYSTDKSGVVKEPRVYQSELAAVAKVPIYGIHEHTFGSGIVGGSLLSGELQGKEIAELGLLILKGEKADSIAVVDKKTVVLEFDYNYLKKFGIELKALPKGAEVINKPFSIFSQFGGYILLILGVVLALMLMLVWSSLNIRMRKNAEQELLDKQGRIEFMAYNDYLTKLPNRMQIKAYTELLMENLKEDEKIAFYFIDLDNFKFINNSFGHKFGDLLLQAVSERFKLLRVETQGSIKVARIGGDEFVVVKKAGEDEHENSAKKLLNMFTNPFHIEEKQIYMSASIGYGIYPDDGLTYDELLVHADMAMFKMKELGKGQVARFATDMDSDMAKRISYQNHLRNAISNKELELLYQPQVNIITQKVVGYEALLRWNSKAFGIVMPTVFIPIAEMSGLIIPIGRWIIEEACEFIKEANIERGELVSVSINISIVQLMQPDFVEMVTDIFKKNKVNMAYIQFEITESVFAENFEMVNEQLCLLDEMGIRIALDDFGTGYSSLTYLKQLPISTLKIDKKFVDDIIIEKDGHFFTSTIIDLGHNLGVNLIAEGVEVVEQVDYLRDRRCVVIQGYLYSKPINRELAKRIKFENKA